MADFGVKARENGPYLIKGQAEYIDVDGVTHQTEGRMVALCRCGGSETKPFCDGHHRTNGFEAPEVVLGFKTED
jgi:CDGSH iron-sulfur domain-containing protein 3